MYVHLILQKLIDLDISLKIRTCIHLFLHDELPPQKKIVIHPISFVVAISILLCFKSKHLQGQSYSHLLALFSTHYVSLNVPQKIYFKQILLCNENDHT
jgi:hypothetical protein